MMITIMTYFLLLFLLQLLLLVFLANPLIFTV